MSAPKSLTYRIDLQALINEAKVEATQKEVVAKPSTDPTLDWIDKRMGTVEKFQLLPPAYQFGVKNNTVLISGLHVTHELKIELARYDLSPPLWLANAYYLTLPVVALDSSCMVQYCKQGFPSRIGSFLKHLVLEGFHSVMDEDWVPAFHDFMILASKRIYVHQGIYYLLLMPDAFVEDNGFTEGRSDLDRISTGWMPCW